MRIVSQDGMVDVSYEQVVLGICDQNNKQEYVIYAYTNNPRPYFIATYSTKAKALKAMKMVREAYNKRKLMEMTYSKGVLVELCKSIGESELAIACSSVFQFPKDDEIEV